MYLDENTISFVVCKFSVCIYFYIGDQIRKFNVSFIYSLSKIMSN